MEEWLAGIGPRFEPAIRGAIEREIAPPTAGPVTPAESPTPEWLAPKWQDEHCFTALVIALRRVDRNSTKGPNAWRAAAAWAAVINVARLLRQLDDRWTDNDWKRINLTPIDYWKKTEAVKRTESQTLSRWLQLNLVSEKHRAGNDGGGMMTPGRIP